MGLNRFALCSDSNGTAAYVTAAQIYGKLIADSLGYTTFTNYSVSGYNTAQIRAQVQASIAAGDEKILMVAGTNDISYAMANNLDIEAAINAITMGVRGAIADCAAANRKLIVGSPLLPNEAMAWTIHLEIERRLQALCFRHGVDFVPFTSFMANQCLILGQVAYDAIMRSDKWHMLAGMHALWHQFFMSRQHIVASGSTPPPSTSAVSIVKTADAYSQIATANYSFANLAIGAADTTRQVVVAVWHYSGVLQQPSSVAIGGVTATLLKRETAPNAVNVGVGLYAASIPSGTAATVGVNFTSAAAECGVSVYRVVNAKTTPFASVSDNTLTSGKLSCALSIPANGGAIAASHVMNSATTFTIAWAGITEDYELALGTSGSWHGFGSASKVIAAAETATIESQYVAPAFYESMVCVSFESI